MKTGFYIYHKTQDGGLFPARVAKAGRKYLYYFDGQSMVKCAISNCMTQNSWMVEQKIATKAQLNAFGGPAKGQPFDVIDCCGIVHNWVGIGWVASREAAREDYQNIPVLIG